MDWQSDCKINQHHFHKASLNSLGSSNSRASSVDLPNRFLQALSEELASAPPLNMNQGEPQVSANELAPGPLPALRQEVNDRRRQIRNTPNLGLATSSSVDARNNGTRHAGHHLYPADTPATSNLGTIPAAPSLRGKKSPRRLIVCVVGTACGVSQ